MKAHRWYSAFRNVGIWALGVVIAWVVIPGLIDSPQQHSALDLMSLIGLMALPLAFIVGVIFPFRSEAEISRRQTYFGWLVGALFGTVVAFGTLVLCFHYMSCPYVPDEQLFAYAQESVDQVSDQAALDAEIGQVLAEESYCPIDVWGNDADGHRKYPELTKFCTHLHRRHLNVSAWREDDTEVGPLFIVRYGNHSNYVWIWFHRRWDRPMNIGSYAREVSPNIVFSSTIFPGSSGKVEPTRSKR